MFGILLLNDETGAEVRTITTKFHEDADQINLEILRLWIEGKGKPLSWDVLIDVLKGIGLTVLLKILTMDLLSFTSHKCFNTTISLHCCT